MMMMMMMMMISFIMLIYRHLFTTAIFQGDSITKR